MTQPMAVLCRLEPLPIYYFFFPLVYAAISYGEIHFANLFPSNPEYPQASGNPSTLGPPSTPRRYLRNLWLYFAKKKRGRAKTQRIKPNIQYQWDPDLDRWAPVLKRPPSIEKYTNLPSSTPGQNPDSFSLLFPLDSGFVVTQTFQDHVRAKEEKGYKYYNGGLDLAYQDAREGAPVYAAASGVLRSASFSGEGYGNVVYLDHLNGYVTIYAHLSGFGILSPGQAVDSGDVIGYLGHTGNCQGGPGNPDGTHLHFELRCLDTPVDPMPFISS